MKRGLCDFSTYSKLSSKRSFFKKKRTIWFSDHIRKSLENDTKALAEHKRQFPWDVEEAFRVEATNCAFDVERLYQQREWNDLFAGKILTRGNFVWKKDFGGDVDFIPSKLGRWTVAWLPDPQNHENKRVK